MQAKALVLFILVLVSCFAFKDRENVKQVIRKMFYHAYDNYMKYAFPLDELRPLTCGGRQSWFSQGLTLIDSLDALVIFGNHTEFIKGVKWTIQNINFNRSVHISVFETNIRILGGLLSAHLLLQPAPSNPPTSPIVHMPEYKGELLQLAKELGDRLVKAFDTKTGIPYGMISLYDGSIALNESQITSTAGGGTHLIEFGVLSALTNESLYWHRARRAAQALYDYRTELGLVGNHINIQTGLWTHRDSGVGASIDSYYEYLMKSYLLFGVDSHYQMFLDHYESIRKYGVYRRPWYVDVDAVTGQLTWPLMNSLQLFWPGVAVQHGEAINQLRESVQAFHTIWRKYGVVPEGYNLHSAQIQAGQKGYPLRPELAESLYFLYRATKDPLYLRMGRDMVKSISMICKAPCGYANVLDVESRTLDDKMESFFLAETLKYLYLLFDEDNFVNTNPYTFNTEGHIIPLSKYFYKLGDVLTTNPALVNSMNMTEARCSFMNTDYGSPDNYMFWSSIEVEELYADTSKLI